MKGDFTRRTFNRTKHFSEVLFQQGRVQLDADLNEQQEILRDSVRTEAQDVIGWAGVPKYGGGFKIDVAAGGEDLTISPGRIYVDGLLCVAEGPSVKISALDGKTLTVDRWPCKLSAKREWVVELRTGEVLVSRMRATKIEEGNRVIHLERELEAHDLEKVKDLSKLKARLVPSYRNQPDLPRVPTSLPEGTYLVYLDVWERLITPLDDPDIREKGLGGPDTADRAKVIWQVKLDRAADNAACSLFGKDWKPKDAITGGELNVRTAPVPPTDDPCLLPGQAGYRGLENQLYRVEINEGGKIEENNVTFKWSQDNGSVITGIDDINGSTITVSGLGPDDVHGFSGGQWVEIVDDATELSQRGGPLVRIKTADRTTNTIVLESPPPILPSPIDKTLHYKLRRWDCKEPCKAEIPATNDGWIALEKGLEIKFSAGGTYRSGDYWLIPARTAVGVEMGSLEWPRDAHGSPIAQPPHGIEHHYAPLALVKVDANNRFQAPPLSDCRNPFPPLIEVGEGEPSAKGAPCCTFVVGDGISTHGDFDDIDDALAALAKLDDGGQLCLLPGDHQVNAVISGKKNIAIRGCGLRTTVSPRVSHPKDPVFKVVGSSQILFSDLCISSLQGVAIALDGNGTDRLQDVQVENCRILGCRAALHVQEGVRVAIRNNQIEVVDRKEGGVAVYMSASDSVIEHNDIVTLSRSYLGGLAIKIPGQAKPFDLYDDCAEFGPLYSNWASHTELTKRIFTARRRPAEMAHVSSAARAQGGIQIAAGSERIRIRDNRIQGGTGNGITLGGWSPLQPGQEEPAGSGWSEKTIEYRGGSFYVEVTKGGAPLAGAAMRMTALSTGETITSVTDREGTFHIADLRADQYSVVVMTPRYHVAEIREDRRTGEHQILVEEAGTTDDRGIFERLGFLREILIEDNRIFQMGRSGIGTSGQAPSGKRDLVSQLLELYGNPILDLTITRNHVVGCLNTGLTDEMIKQLPFKGVGGISIGFCEDLTIVENRIEHNGLASLPVSGIFVGWGEHVEIASNRIQQNGAVPSGFQGEFTPGFFRGGIFVLLGSCVFDPEAIESRRQHAVRIHGNTVSQPVGRALAVGAFGPVAVQDNYFDSHRCLALPFQQLGSAVCIINLGRPQRERRQPGDNLPSGDVLFSGNQSQVGMLHSNSLPHLVFSLDDVSFEGNQLRTSQLSKELYINTLVWAQTARVRGNRFQEPPMKLAASLVSRASEMNITTDNQGDHCIFASAGNLININNQMLQTIDCRNVSEHLDERLKQLI